MNGFTELTEGGACVVIMFPSGRECCLERCSSPCTVTNEASCAASFGIEGACDLRVHYLPNWTLAGTGLLLLSTKV